MNTKILSYIALALGICLVVGKIGMRMSNRAEKQQSLYVINVLDKALYDDCHITASIQVPFDKAVSFSKGKPKETEFVIYCSNYMCTASGDVARQLMAQGFTHVWAYEAGMAEWYQRGLPTVGKAASGYLTKENKSFDTHENSVNIITTDELKEKMEKAGLLR